MRFVPLSEIKDQNQTQDLEFTPLQFVPLQAEPTEPTLSPEEQVMSAVGAPGEPTKPAEPRKPSDVPEMRAWEPTIWERIQNLIPGDRAKAANEYAARQIAKVKGVSVDEAYRQMKESLGVRGVGGTRPSGQPMFNPEGRAPIKATAEAAPYVFEGLLDIPKGMAESALRAYRAGDIENAVDFGDVDKMITYLGDESKEIFIPNIPKRLGMDTKDPNYQGFMGLGKSLGYSLTTMVASATAGTAATATTGSPIAGVAAGMGTSGAVAYRASKDDFLDRLRDKLNKDSQKVFNRPMSDAEWKEAKEKFNSAAVEYGAWEAIPEAISNAIFLKAFSAPVKGAKGAKLAGYLEKATSIAAENITETATGLGQNAAELKAGLTQDELTIADAFKQQFIQTMLTMGVTAGGMKGVEYANKFYNEQVLPKIDPASALAKAIKADLDNVGYTPAAFRMKSVTDQEARPPVQLPVAPVPPVAVGEPPEEPTAPAGPTEPTFTFEPLSIEEPGGRVEPRLETPQRVVRPEDLAAEALPGMPTGAELEEEGNAVTPAEPTQAQMAATEAAVKPTQAAAALPEVATVPPVTAPKAFEPAAPQHEMQGLPTQEVPLSELKLSKDVPQFKIGASDKGVVEPLGGKFERTGVAPIQVWRRLDGTLEVISGRHRFDLAQRSGEKTIPAQIHDESQGFGKLQAAILDAELNIRDGQGKVKDYVNYFKESGIDRETADSRGLLARATGKRSFTIANEGSDELVAAVRGDQIGDEAAYYIALNAPGDSRLQGVGIKAIQDGKSANTATNMMQAVKALAGEQDTTTDMFGFDDSAIKEAEAMAKIASQKQREIQTRLNAISGAAKNPAVAKAEGIDIRDPQAVQRRIGELRQMKAAWDNWSTNPQLVAEIRAERGVPAPELAPVEEPVAVAEQPAGPSLFEQPADTTDTPAEEAAQIKDKTIREKLMEVANNLGVRVFETSDRPVAGDGYVQIPPEDKLVEGSQSAEQVFAHELGHAIMQKRGMAFNQMSHEQVAKWIKGWPQIREISKAFRPEVYKSKMPKTRRHANKPDEIIADALGSFLLGQSTREQIKPLLDGIGLSDYDLGLKPSVRREMEDKALAEIEAKNLLKAQTEEELRQKAEREAAEVKRVQEEQRAAERKAKADEEVGEFVLTGSDRAADEAAARGQQDIFAAPQEPTREELFAPVRNLAEKLLDKGTVRYEDTEFEGKIYQARTRMFEGKLFGSELRTVQEALGDAREVTLINQDDRVMTFQFTGKFVGEGRNVRIMDTQYVPTEDGQGRMSLENIELREEQIKEYAKLRSKLARVPGKVAKGEASLDMQETVARMMQQARDLQFSIRASKPRRDSAEKFLAKALTEFDNGNISADVLNVIQTAYQKNPELLEGLLLSVKALPEGKGGTAGEFIPWTRIVRLYKGTSGVDDPVTIRHELTHTLEQMMKPEQRMAVVQAWGKALARAIKQNPDELHQKYFNAVLDFLDKPNERTYALARQALPSYDMYQFINPSEFWAVNGEKLMASELGSAWDKFKRAVRKLLEGLKKVLGFDNRYDIHKVFNQVMGGSKERMGEDMLVDMVKRAGTDYVTLENIEDEKKLMEKYSRPHTPQLDTTPIKTFITRQFKNGKEFFQDAAENPREAMVGAGDSVMDGLIYLRNKNVWYGSGLEARDFDRYNGELKTAEGFATASVALDNAIRSGNIGVEVIFRGGIKYDPKSGNFVAVERKQGMKGVYEAEAALKKKLGNQLGTDIIQGYLEAKRSISIMNELYEREANYESAKETLKALREMGADEDDIAIAKAQAEELQADLDAIKKAASSVNMSEEEMYEFAALDKKHTELRDIMDNWTAVNQNLLRMWRQVGLLSQGRYDTLSKIEDYVPWYRIMADEEDVHSPLQATTRSLTNIGREKLFKRGKPISVVDFRAKEGQKDFKIQPSSVVKVEVNGKPVAEDLVSVTPSGEVRIDMDLKDNDLVVFNTNREIENIIDNMTRNVMRMTMNGIRQYAANRIVMEYASRNEKGKIATFPGVDKEKGRFNWMVNGKKVVVEIQDPLVAASIYGMENLNLQMWAPLAAVANLTRRSITLSGVFQLKQVFKDAPTAALVTGVKNPLALIGGVWKGFLTSLTMTDPAVDILKAAGIGGFHSPARTPEADIKRRLGIMNRNVFSAVIQGLDHIGDASDMAQRVAVYKRVLAETGDETQALYQAANVINFLHHGSAGYAQAAVKVVPFLGAYANSMDVLIRALMGGGLKGMSRKKALARLSITMSMLVSLTLLYAMLAGADPEYDELDDQTKLKNIIIPGTKIMLPMNTSAAYFFKAIPELIYNKVTREGTENEYDRRRLRKALGDAARDMLIGPEPIPAGVKPLFEVAINHDFFSGRPVIPEGLKDVEAAEQYTANTSELAKKLSAMLEIPGTDGKRVVSPIEADHLIRGIFGTSGAMAQWVSNSIGTMAESRPEPTARETPVTGSFLRDEVPRGREDLFYDFKEAVSEKYQTWKKMMDRGDDAAADAYLDKHGDIVGMYEYINEAEAELKEINAEIRRLGETREKDMTPRERRLEIEDYKRLKNEVLDPVKELRREVLK